MNGQHDLEREISAILAEAAPTRPPDHLLPSVISSARRTRRWPRWFALVKEPTMHTDSRLTVGSPTVRVAVAMATTLALILTIAGAGIAASRLIDPPQTFVVAADGTGDATTIADGVAMAADGDTVRVRAGTYVEAVTIDRDITLTRDGDGDEVVVVAPEGGPALTVQDPMFAASSPYAILVDEARATVSGLTFRGVDSRLAVRGGAPMLADLVFDGVGVRFKGPNPDSGGIVLIGSRTTIRESVFAGGSGIRAADGAHAQVLSNELTDGASIAGAFGNDAVIRGNTITDGLRDAITVFGPTTARIEGNTISGTPFGITLGQRLYQEDGAGVEPLVLANTITGSSNAIFAVVGSSPTIEANTLIDNAIAIAAWAGGDLEIMKNDIIDNRMGITVGGSSTRAGGSPGRIEDNRIRGGDVGIAIGDGANVFVTDNRIEGTTSHGVIVIGASPSIVRNRICAGGMNVFVGDGLEPVLQDNELCPDGSPVAAASD